MADFERTTQLFDVAGINLAKPVDRLEPNEYRKLDNCRPYGEGKVQGRQGITRISLSGTTGDPAHSLYTFEDPIPSPSAFPGAFVPRVRLLGTGTELLAARDTTNPTAFVGVGDGSGFSGRPMSFVVSGSEQSQRPWAFIGDFDKMLKVSSALLGWQIGVAPPNFIPEIAVGAANAEGPDVGASPNGYIYAFRARTDPLVNTGAKSILGPPVRQVDALFPSSAAGAAVPPSNIEITLSQAHPDAQVRFIDVFRWGGSLTTWLYVGSVNNIVNEVLTDSFSDQALANAAQDDLNDNQPFLSVDGNLEGTGTVTNNGGVGEGSLLQITAGDTLRAYNATGSDPYYIAGNQISIGNQLFTFFRSPDDANTVELLEDSVVSPVSGTFIIYNPEMARQAIPCIWGPFGGGLTGTFIFGCGDPLRPGSLYWTKGNNPESHPGSNVLDLSSASEPLMNGCIYNGNNYVFSTKRAWALYPTLGQISDFAALEIPNSKGLFARWGICVTPHGICFVGKDGIYLTTGGAPVSLTDESLYPLFPQESQDSNSFPVIDGLNETTFAPPDFDQPDTFRLSYGDGFLYFDFIDTAGTYRTLVYCFEQRKPGWVSRDTYTPQVISRHFENVHNEATGGSWQKGIMGSVDGFVFEFGGNTDNEQAIAGHVRTGSYDAGDPRPRKLWGDIELDLDARCDTFNLKAGFDNYSFLTDLSTTGTNLTGRHRSTSDINAGQGQYAYNLGLDIQWTVTESQPILYFWVPTRVPKPELTALRVTDWDDAGYAGPKFFQGFYLRADTLNIERQIAVLSDGGTIQQTFAVQHPNEQERAYVFTTPFISDLIRLWPQDANFWRLLGIRWIYNIAPPLVTTWITQETTHDLPGWIYSREDYIALISSADVTLSVAATGNLQSPFSYTIPATGSVYSKVYLPMQPMKAKAYKYSLTSSAGFRLFERDCSVLVKPWGVGGPFLVKQPFGDISRDQGAKI